MDHKRKIAVIGLGYVGLTTAVAFGNVGKVIAYDKSTTRIAGLIKGHDRNEEVSDAELQSSNLQVTHDPLDLKQADFFIITVPTPLDKIHHPDFSMLLNATENVGKCLKKGDIVVYESTVYPGATEEKCVPVLEKISKLKYGKDFTVGFSPERINPADKEHTFYNIKKIVSGTDKKTLKIISDVYKSVVKAGVFPVSSIRVAEATKVIENTQRDVNIALMNDIAIMLHTLGMQTKEVLAAMKTKWNHIPIKPGLVGGHCIGVNSYYLLHKAQEVGYYSDIIMASRRVNEYIAKYITLETIKKLIHMGVPIKRAKIAILGITYKENCSDLRDTRVIDIIRELKSYDTQVLVHDPIADASAAKHEYGITLEKWDDLNDLDAMIITVAHKQYIHMDRKDIEKKLNSRGLIMDVKNIFKDDEFKETAITLWSL